MKHLPQDNAVEREHKSREERAGNANAVRARENVHSTTRPSDVQQNIERQGVMRRKKFVKEQIDRIQRADLTFGKEWKARE
jgi:hypothetical protein